MNIYTLIGNVLVSSDKEKATLTVVNHSYALIHTENSIPKPTDH